MLVKPGAASKQFEEEEAERGGETVVVPGGKTENKPGPGPGTLPPGEVTPVTVVAPPQPTRFYGSVRLDPTRPVRDAEKVIAEVVQHLTALAGADVVIRVEVEARYHDGLPDKLVRDLTENCGALKFDSCEFDKS